jgi:hypothetical protein
MGASGRYIRAAIVSESQRLATPIKGIANFKHLFALAGVEKTELLIKTFS